MTISPPRPYQPWGCGKDRSAAEKVAGGAPPPPATLADLQATWPEAYALLIGTLQKLGAVEAELRGARALNEHYRFTLAGYRELVSGDDIAGSA